MTRPNLTTPCLLSLLDEFDHNCEDDKTDPAWAERHRKTFAYALEGVQAMIDNGRLVTGEEYESERRWATKYFNDWALSNERLGEMIQAVPSE
jgi:hypothetical protein